MGFTIGFHGIISFFSLFFFFFSERRVSRMTILFFHPVNGVSQDSL